MKRYQKISNSTAPGVTIVDHGGPVMRHFRRPDYTHDDAIATVDWLNEREVMRGESLRVPGSDSDHAKPR